MSELQHIGPALELLMKRREINQKDLATVADMPPAQLNRYLRGVKTPQLASLERLLEALGADLRELADALEEVGGERPSNLAELTTPIRRVASHEEAEEIRARLRRQDEGTAAPDDGVTEIEFRSLLRRLVEDAVAAQKRLDRGRTGQPLGTGSDNDDQGSAP